EPDCDDDALESRAHQRSCYQGRTCFAPVRAFSSRAKIGLASSKTYCTSSTVTPFLQPCARKDDTASIRRLRGHKREKSPAVERERTVVSASFASRFVMTSILSEMRTRKMCEALARSRAANLASRASAAARASLLHATARLAARCAWLSRIVPSSRIFKPFAAKVAPVVVISTIASAVPAAGAPSVAPALSTMR